MSWARIEHPRPFLEQWQRVNRWYARLQALTQARTSGPDDLMDHALAVLQNCFVMRDWLLVEFPTDPPVKEFFASTQELGLCRDIVNGSKHLRIKTSSVDPAHRLHREYVPASLDRSHPNGYELIVAWGGNGDTMHLLDLTSRCVDQIAGFLQLHGLLPEQ
jgi:hypothetical protein